MQALSMSHRIGEPDRPVRVYRLVTKGTLEERVHQLVDKKKGSDLVFKSSIRYHCLLPCCSFNTYAVYCPTHAFGACCGAFLPPGCLRWTPLDLFNFQEHPVIKSAWPHYFASSCMLLEVVLLSAKTSPFIFRIYDDAVNPTPLRVRSMKPMMQCLDASSLLACAPSLHLPSLTTTISTMLSSTG